jgi:flagellar M-ring protein FliF
LDLARLWEQFKELWAKRSGKVIIGLVTLFIITLAGAGIYVSRPTYRPLGTFDAQSAPKVQQKLQEKRIPYTQTPGDPYTFQVKESDWNAARLVVAELNLDPDSVKWATDKWSEQSNWMMTDFDKRRALVEQLQTELSRAVSSISAVNRARVTLTVPMTDRLFKEDQTKPKASVIVEPKPGQKLTTPIVEAIMSTVAGAVDGLDKKDVVVVDTTTNQIVSEGAFAPKPQGQATLEQTNDRLTIQKNFEQYWQAKLTAALEQVVGPKNASVIVNPVFDWESVMKEGIEYTGANGGTKGVVVSSQKETSAATGSGTTTQTPAGTTPNAEAGPPTYPGAQPNQTGPLSEEKVKEITNYLVSQTKTISEKPGGAIKSISVGVMVNNAVVKPEDEPKLTAVIASALGNNASVQVAAIPFNNPFDKVFEPAPQAPSGLPTQWLWWILGAALALAGIAYFISALRPKRPVLEPVYTGPEAGMMGGIPVSDLELVLGSQAPGSQDLQDQQKLPQAPEDLAQLAPEEIALLGDDFLHQLGVDPAKVRMKEKVEKIAKANPEAVANLIKTWIADE